MMNCNGCNARSQRIDELLGEKIALKAKNEEYKKSHKQQAGQIIDLCNENTNQAEEIKRLNRNIEKAIQFLSMGYLPAKVIEALKTEESR